MFLFTVNTSRNRLEQQKIRVSEEMRVEVGEFYLSDMLE